MATVVNFGNMSQADLVKMMEKMQAENAALKANRTKLSLKVSTKGAISIYGLGRWPVTLYRSQAEMLFTAEMCKTVHDFIDANDKALKIKGE